MGERDSLRVQACLWWNRGKEGEIAPFVKEVYKINWAVVVTATK